MKNPEVLVVGGGISGLSTAWWLAQRGIAVELWEADERPGGKIRTRQEQGYLTERAAGLLVNFRPEIDRMVEAAGLVRCRRSRDGDLKRYVLHQSRLAAVPMKLGAMARSPFFSWQAKLRMATEILVPRGGHERESAADFIIRRLGREILATALDPYIAGTLASDPHMANAGAVLPRLTQLERRYGSITLGMLVNRLLRRRRANLADTFSFRQGMSELVETLADTPGVRLRCGRRMTGIARKGQRWLVSARDDHGEHQMSIAQLVLATPADVAACALSDLDAGLAEQLRGIEYAPLSVLHLGFERQHIDHPLDGSGFLVPSGAGLNINGNLWMSNLFPERAAPDRVLLTSYLGGARQPQRAAWSEQRMLAHTLRDLSPLLGVRGDPEYVRIDRHPRGLPLYHGPYLQRIQAIERGLRTLPGLHLNANYMHGVAVRERMFQGMKCALTIEKNLMEYESNLDYRRSSTSGEATPALSKAGD